MFCKSASCSKANNVRRCAATASSANLRSQTSRAKVFFLRGVVLERRRPHVASLGLGALGAKESDRSTELKR